MDGLYNSLCLTGVAKTITDIFGIAPPECAAPSISAVTKKAEKIFKNKKADRIFIYNPDAIALWLFQKYTDMFDKAFLNSEIQIPLLSVMPSVTPVCFASIYTGAMPEIHGIQAYIKPVLKTDTVFDALLRAGLKPAIISTSGDSISKIFLERDMDYFIYDTVDECNQKAFELIDEDKYDLIVLYNGNYDSAMHRNGPEGAESLEILKQNVDIYEKIVKAIESKWVHHRTLIGFCPDHGCHEIDSDCGSHGLDMAEDMNIIHFYSFR